MKEISKKMEAIPNSAIRKIFDMCEGVDDLVKFTVGEPDFPTPKRIINAAIAALERGETKYTSNRGVLELRNAIAETAKKKKHIEADPLTEIIVTNGGMQALYFAMHTLTNPGDEIIIGSPYFTNYLGQVLMADAVPKFVPLREENNFLFDPEELEAAITDKTKAILMNFPSNPLGSAMDRATMQKVADIAIKYDLFVITDEVYQEYLYDDDVEFISIASLPGMKERTVIVDSFSKTYAMTGWRIGYAIAPAQVINYMVKMQEGNASCVNAPAQYAALEALTGPQDDLEEMIAVFKKRRDLIVSEINKIEGVSCAVPKGAFYLFVNIKKTGLGSDDFAVRLLQEGKVAVIPGNAFGPEGEGYVRMTYVTSEENILEGTRRMKCFIDELNK